MVWWSLIYFIGSFLLTAILASHPKLEDARRASLDDLEFPQADEGGPVAILLGTRRILAPNTIWYGDLVAVPVHRKMDRGLFRHNQELIVAYRYFLGFDLSLCLGPGAHLRRIWLDKDEVWSGDAGPDPTAITVDKPDIFGGPEHGGGFVAGAPVLIDPFQWSKDGYAFQMETYAQAGPLRFYGGSFTQVANAYLDALVTDLPAYNGM